MVEVNQVICLFLMQCFGDPVHISNQDQMKCKVYSAPKDGYDWKTDSKSLICLNINHLTVNNLKPLEPINTLAVGIDENMGSNDKKDPSNYDFYINNLYFYGTRRGSPLSNFYSISSLIGLNVNALQELSFVKLNLAHFDWRYLQKLKELKYIHIEDCELPILDHNNLGLLSSLHNNIVSVSITKSGVKEINNFPFNDWNQLKVLSIVGNPLEDIRLSNKKIENLWYLDLHDNYIHQIPDDFHKNLPKLRDLNLDNNNLKLLYWEHIRTLLTLEEFSLEKNTICMNKDVVKLYDELKTVQKFPKLLRDSMNNLMCKDVSTDTSANSDIGFLCKNHETQWTGISDDRYLEHCVSWPGEKKRTANNRNIL